MVKGRFDNHGVTLMELLVAATLSGLVIYTVGNMYASGMRQAVETQDAVLATDPKATLEIMAKIVSVGYDYRVPSASELWIRVDGNSVTPQLTLTPNYDPEDVKEDTWIKFRCYTGGGGKIRYRRDTKDEEGEAFMDNPRIAVDKDDPVLLNNVACASTLPNKRTRFQSVPNGNVTRDRAVRITLVTHPTKPEADRPSVTTEVTLASKSMAEA